MAEIVRRRSWGGILPLGRHCSTSGSSRPHCVSVSIAPPHLGRSPGKVTWEGHLGRSPGKVTWEGHLGRSPGKVTWEGHLGRSPGKEQNAIPSEEVQGRTD